MKGHKQAAFHVRFIEIPVLEHGVVSQQYNGMQQTNPLECRYTRHCHSQSIRIKSRIHNTPCKTRAVHCNDTMYTPTVFRTIQALAIASYIYSLQLVTGDINGRTVSPAGLLN